MKKMANLLFAIGFIIDTIGKILLGMTVITVHSRIASEKRIDKQVIAEMNRERTLGYVGVIMIVIGASMQLIYFT